MPERAMLTMSDENDVQVSISIVSHGQCSLVYSLLEDLGEYCDSRVEVILTINIPEELPLS